jgi:hypothetical protein
MPRSYPTVLDLVGNTPVVRLQRITEGLAPTVLAKLEYLNPGGSVKDRIGLRMIEAAEREGKLRPGGTIVEPTSGNTGVGLALVCILRGYKLVCTCADKIPAEKVAEFKEVFLTSLQSAQLVEKRDDKYRILDTKGATEEGASTIKKLSTTAKVSASDSCFVLMPFGPPVGDYYQQIYEPAIRKAGLRPVRADADIFGTGKIIDQIWDGINAAKVLVAELTSRNPNVFYELGLAHALDKPVVLISSNEDDVPFDLKHIRVIYYNVTDPFWGEKLIEKVAENILSALSSPEEAVFKRALNR